LSFVAFVNFFTNQYILSASPISLELDIRLLNMNAQFQNLKNFIRHGKQARNAQNQPAPSTQTHAFSDPVQAVAGNIPGNQKCQQDYTGNPLDNKNLAAHAGGVVAHAAGKHQNLHQQAQNGDNIASGSKLIKIYDEDTLAKIIAEENANREKLSRYPGLERYDLLQKMGDGAFSNVYRARDTHGVHGEIAIKVVRKFELNASQVCRKIPSLLITRICVVVISLDFLLFFGGDFIFNKWDFWRGIRVTITFIRM
jgi:hypothetical protein